MSVFTRMGRCAVLTAVLATALAAGPVLAQDFTVNLKETDIQELIKFVAEATGTTIVVDPAVKGKVKVISSKPVSRDELYDLFLSILEVHGYTAVRSGAQPRSSHRWTWRQASLSTHSPTVMITPVSSVH